MTTAARTLHTGLVFPEGLRWHQQALWFSDQHDGRVWRAAADGPPEVVCEVPAGPSGLGWLPDGRLLVVSMRDNRLLRREPDGELVEHADLRGYQGFRANDMVVDAHGRAYVGFFGFDLDAVTARRGRVALLERPGPPSTVLVRVDPDGSHRAVADDLAFPNGTVLLDDGAVLVVAETIGSRLTAFDVLPDGGLTRRRTWAALTPPAVAAVTGSPGLVGTGVRALLRRLDETRVRPALDRSGISPDGTCADAEGAIWVANARHPECVRLAPGGQVLERVRTSQPAFACVLGGHDLFVATAPTFTEAELVGRRDGRIETARVTVPGPPA
ncbi:SMP-30/gluconolactonase/LRE family protein [Rhodococcus aerolatus]